MGSGRPQQAEGPSVLLAEDEAVLSNIVRRNLEARQYRVTAVETAEEALAAISAEAPSVLLLDINLPDRSGWDVLRELRSQGRRVPTVVVTSLRCSPARLAEFHPDVYLPKPFPLTALLSAVERLSGRSAPVSAATGG